MGNNLPPSHYGAPGSECQANTRTGFSSGERKAVPLKLRYSERGRLVQG